MSANICAARTGSIGDSLINVGDQLEESVSRFISASSNVLAPAADASSLDEDIEQIRAEEAELEQRRRESEFYRLIRKAFIGQSNGDFDLGIQLQEVFREVEEPLTESEFDACMARALSAIAGKEGV